jgi:signal transduction histidine kinase
VAQFALMLRGGTEAVPPSSAEAQSTDATRARIRAGTPFRQRMLERVLWAAWLALTVAMLVLLREVLTTAGASRWPVLEAIACAWVVIGVSAAGHTLDLRWRGAGLYIGFAIACVATVSHGAYHGPNGFIGLGAACVLVALGLGGRAGWLALAASSLILTLLAGLFVTSTLDMTDAAQLDVHAAGNWARAIVIFSGLTGAIVACASYLTARLEREMLRSQALLDALAVENRQRIDALEQQHQLFRQLQHAQKLEAVGTLAGGVAHDFNNLLLVIVSHAGLIRRCGGEPGVTAASIQAIEEAAWRAADLTRQLLAFGRGNVEAERGALELDAALARSLELIRSLLPESIELRCTGSEAPIAIWAAQLELDQVLMNLCINARDAMPGGGLLEVSTSLVPPQSVEPAASPQACISVRDTGTGISSEHQARIFDPFFTTKAAGTGLGLSVVHGIVAQWNGRIEVSSEPGRGTELRVYVPRVDDDPSVRS